MMKFFQRLSDIKSKAQLAMPFDLRLVLIFTLLSIIFVLVPPFNQTPIRVPLALPLLLFIPGYSLVSLLFPRKDDLTGIERLTLSIVLSIAIAIFDSFALNYTPWGVRPAPIVISLALITLLLLLIMCILRKKKNIPADERFLFDYHVFRKLLKADEKPTKIEKALIVALIASIFIASGIMIYEKLTFPEEKFTAFYILGEGGRMENYTTDLYFGRSTSITVGFENHEHTTINYTLEAKFGRSTLNSQKITLDHDENWLGTVSFIVNRIGPRTKLEFLLYKEESANPDKSLHLWVASHIDYENLEVLKDYTIAQPPEIRNRDMELAPALESDWVYTSNNRFFRGIFFNSTSPASPENSTIRGYITNTITGLPIANASIEVNNHYGYKNRVLTEENGYYELKTIADLLWLDAWRYGYEKNSTEFDVADGQILVLNMTLETLPLFNVTIERLPAEELQLPSERLKVEKLPPEKLSPVIPTLTGYVTDSVTDLPIANAHVRATDYRGFEERATTNERGYFEMRVIPKYLTIIANANGYMWNSASFDVSKKRTINLKLTPENSTVKGYIFDAVGKPIANAHIRVGNHAERYKQTYYKDTVSNAMGYYEISTIAGHIWLDASKNGYFLNGMEFEIVYGESKKIDMRLDPMPAENARVSGYVFYNDTGAGLDGVKVVVSDHNYYERSTFTDSSGYYEIDTVPGHLWLDVHPKIYMNSIELDIAAGQTLSVDIKLDASPIDAYRISYPSESRSEYGYYGAIYQDIESEEGIAVLSFKVKDSRISNKSAGFHFKQVVLNDVVIWEDDVAGDEEWQQVKIPISLESGKNRIMLRVYEKRGVSGFLVNVWWDDVEIEPFSELLRAVGMEFNIRDTSGGENYPAILLGEPSEFLAIVRNNEMLRNDYTLQVKLGGYLLGTWKRGLDSGEEWRHKISFVPNQLGSMKLEFILLKNEMPCRSVPFAITSTVGENVTALQIYASGISIPGLANGDMESANVWSLERNNGNFSGKIINTAATSPTNSYEISYPQKTLSNPGDYCEMSQNFTANDLPAVVLVSFNVKDSYLGDNSGYHLKQALLNGNIVWEDDVAGDEGWQHVKIPVTLYDKENELTLRVYEENSVRDFPISVWWDDVEIKPIHEIKKKPAVEFYIYDIKGRDYSPAELHLGEPSEFTVVTRNNERFENPYVLQLAIDGEVVKTSEFWLNA